ncbi:interferon-induced protein 44-like isoform X2 [Pelmatolapia mariae]|uniref:interferon-induced protein 44-like isoform X2 n=1 Tax=Pelmatolapia mariae TaxID=158779 RepID=UPI002FE57E75
MFELLLFSVAFFFLLGDEAMGGQSSQPDDSLSSKNLENEWRKLEWSKENDLQYINTYQPHNSEIQYLRILLYGPTGSEKSSFINSVDAALRGRTTSQALANAAPQENFTKPYTTFKIQKGEPGTFYPFAFTYIMGVDKDKKKEFSWKTSSRFNTETSISKRDRDYSENPGLSDKVYVLVSVISVSQAKTLSDKYMKKMKDVRQEATHLRIPQRLLLTKID